MLTTVISWVVGIAIVVYVLLFIGGVITAKNYGNE